jgi:hypothetical protein
MDTFVCGPIRPQFKSLQMKKIIQAMFALFAIGAFILGTQISCQKAAAQTNAGLTTTSPGLILFDQQVTSSAVGPVDSSGRSTTVTVYSRQYYVASLDGTNPRPIPITLPSGLYAQAGGHLTIDGKTLVFPVNKQSGPLQFLYSCAIDGSSTKQVMNLSSTSTFDGAY